MRHRTADTNELLAITGPMIATVKIEKKAWIWPLQRCAVFDVQPRDYSLNLQAMTKEKLQCLIPVVFTVGPDVSRYSNSQTVPIISNAQHDTQQQEHHHQNPGAAKVAPQVDDRKATDDLVKYAMLLAGGKSGNRANKTEHIENIVKGIIEGETRVVVSSMTMEEIFSQREEFKRKINEGIQGEMDQFGLRIYNANVKELRDAPGSNYFQSLSQKAHEGAINQARIDVAAAQKLGNVGEAQRHGEQNREIAKINAETAVQKTERDSEKAKAEATLATRKAMYNRDVEIAQIEATRATESVDEKLRKDVEMKRAQTELERLRASDVVKATVLRESKQQAADAKKYEAEAQSNAVFYSEQKAADAHAYNEQKTSDANAYKQQKTSDANAYKEQKAADAHAYAVKVAAAANFDAAAKDAEAVLIRQEKEAAGLTAMAGAYANLSQAFGGPAGLIQYLMIEKGVYTELAKANADAVRGLNPKMTIWNTGSNTGSEGASGSSTGAGGIDSIRNMYQMLPPLMTTINEQTGVVLPEWQFGKLGEQISERERTGKAINGLAKENGNGNGARQ